MALFDTIRAGASGAGETYEIQNSLRNNDGAYLNSSFSGNNQTFTVAMWIKRSRIDGNICGHVSYESSSQDSES